MKKALNKSLFCLAFAVIIFLSCPQTALAKTVLPEQEISSSIERAEEPKRELTEQKKQEIRRQIAFMEEELAKMNTTVLEQMIYMRRHYEIILLNSTSQEQKIKAQNLINTIDKMIIEWKLYKREKQ